MKKKGIILALILLLGVFGFLIYEKTHKYVEIDPQDAQTLLSDAIVETKTIKIPGFRNAYNPSLVQNKGGYLLSFRVDSYSLVTYVQHLLNHRVSFQGLVQLDRNLEVAGRPQLIDVRSYDPKYRSVPQDGRLLGVGEKIYLFYNDNTTSVRSSQEMFIAEIVEEAGLFRFKEPAKHLTYSGSQQKVEKNWSPFAYEQKIYVVYRIQPHTILEIDLETGVCQEVAETKSALSWQFGEMRGGTPAYLVDGEYISFFHSSKKGFASNPDEKTRRIFFMGAYTFESSPPFSIKAMTPKPLGTVEYYRDDNSEKIVYPSGLVIEKDFIYVAWGKNDAQVCITLFDREKLLSLMHP